MTDIALERDALALFEAMLEANPRNASDWLDAHAGGRADLRARVQALLSADTLAELRTGGAAGAADAVDANPPERLGGYIIVRRIGSGGMGSVYLAARDRNDFSHTAAIKIIRPGLLSQRLVDRFRRERQILAQLRHPNIAQLLDGGETDDGSPYFIMEYVEGQPLLAWAEQAKASRADRLDKLLQACDAVAFAHANLIVHRDITPSNVLVTKSGVVKLIDFGIARPAGDATAPERPASGASLQTLSLTPGYAAPERMTGAEPTTAVDVFSLGRLAAHLFESDSREKDLQAMLARATAPDPQQRYASVELFAADLRAWRDGFPLSVRRGQPGYALIKFVRRRRGFVAVSALAIAMLAVAFAATGFAWWRAEQARAAELVRFNDVRTLARYLLFDLNDQLRKVPGNTAARADLAARAQTYLDALAASPQGDSELALETALGLVRLAEIQDSPLTRNLGQSAPAKKNLARAREILLLLQAKTPGDPRLRVAHARIAAIAGMIAFYEDTDADASLEILARGKADLDAVPAAGRTIGWRVAQRDLSRAEMERFSANEEFEALLAAADQHDGFVSAWPASEQGGSEAAVEHAVAGYNRGLALSLTGREADGYPLMRAAHAAFARAERERPGDPDLLYWIAWAGSDAYAAAARIDRQVEAEDLLVSAQAAAQRLAAVQDKDESARVLSYNVAEVYAQHLGNLGRYAEAIAAQQRIVAAKVADMDATSSGADAGWSELILATIAKAGKQRAIACEAFTRSEAYFARAERLDRLVAFHRAFLPNLRANVALCEAGRPVSEFKPMR